MSFRLFSTFLLLKNSEFDIHLKFQLNLHEMFFGMLCTFYKTSLKKFGGKKWELSFYGLSADFFLLNLVTFCYFASSFCCIMFFGNFAIFQVIQTIHITEEINIKDKWNCTKLENTFGTSAILMFGECVQYFAVVFWAESSCCDNAGNLKTFNTSFAVLLVQLISPGFCSLNADLLVVSLNDFSDLNAFLF